MLVCKNANLALTIVGFSEENLVLSSIAIAFNYSAGTLIWILTFFLSIVIIIQSRWTACCDSHQLNVEIDDWKRMWELYKFSAHSTCALFIAGSVTTTFLWFFSVLLVGFRHHLFVWSVFAPKFFYLLFNCIYFEGVLLLINLLTYLWTK